MKTSKVLSMIGLCAKAGRVQSGEFSTEKSVKSFRSYLVIVAEDASENTKKNFRDMCAYYKVAFAVYGQKADLGHAIGREFRASLAIEDEGFAKSILKKMELENNLEGLN